MLTRTAVGEPGAGPYAVAVDAAGVAWTTLVHTGQVARLPPGGPPELHDLGNPAARPSLRTGLDLLRDVSMEVTAQIGSTRMTISELLSLNEGAVVELDRAAGAPADLLVNGHLIARGEVVVIDENFALRIVEIVADDPVPTHS